MPNSLLLFVQKDCEAQHAALWTQRLQAAHCGIAFNGGTNQTFCNSHEPLLHQDPQLIQDVSEHCREDLQFGPVSMQDNCGEQLIDAHTHGLLLKLSLLNFSFQRYICCCCCRYYLLWLVYDSICSGIAFQKKLAYS